MADGTLIKVAAPMVPPVGVTFRTRYKDKLLASPYDLDGWDALHPMSWPSQANPVGGDALYNLASPLLAAAANNNTIGSGTPLPTFNGGFLFANGSQAAITMNAVCKPAITSKGYLHMQWCFLRETTAIRKVFGWGTTGSWAYGMYHNNVTRQFILMRDGVSETVTLQAADFPIDIGGVKYGLFLVGVGRQEDGAGGFQGRNLIYSKGRDTIVSNVVDPSAADAAQSSQGSSSLGYASALGTNNTMRFYRGRHYDVGNNAGIMTSTAFKAIFDAEVAAKKAATGWNLA